MKILHVHPGPDTAGQSMAGKRVLESLGDEVRVFARSPEHAFRYPAAQKWDDSEVRASYRWADVVVIHNQPGIHDLIANGPRRPEIVVHHHGSIFRGHPADKYAEAEAIGARQIVSTLDLLLSVPDGGTAQWIPQVIDTDRMRAIRDLHYSPGGRVKVSHAPTNKAIKGTKHVIRAMRLLRKNADFLLVQNQPWTVCLALKATSDVFVDQLSLGYGNNAIEAWAMGIPVIAAAPEPILERMRLEFDGGLPFYLANVPALAQDLQAMIEDPDLRRYWSERGEIHVARFHAPQAWARRVRALYMGEPLTIAA